MKVQVCSIEHHPENRKYVTIGVVEMGCKPTKDDNILIDGKIWIVLFCVLEGANTAAIVRAYAGAETVDYSALWKN